MGCITVVLIKMIFWALCKVIMDFALRTLHNQRRPISDHIYNVDNTHDNNTPHSPSEDTDQLKAWSHRRTDMYRRENGLKPVEFGYLVTKFISSAAQRSRDRHVEPRCQAMTVRAPDM